MLFQIYLVPFCSSKLVRFFKFSFREKRKSKKFWERQFFPRPATLFKKRLWRRSFPVNFAKFLRTPFLQNTSLNAVNGWSQWIWNSCWSTFYAPGNISLFLSVGNTLFLALNKFKGVHMLMFHIISSSGYL